VDPDEKALRPLIERFVPEDDSADELDGRKRLRQSHHPSL
jgi:hypothetical protein